MGKELIISATRHENKVAVLEDDQLVEIYFQRANEYSLAGSIHKGRVTRVLPGMQSAFVDIGLERDAFLYVSDFFEENEEYDRIPGTEERQRPERYERPERSERPERAERSEPAATAPVVQPAPPVAPPESAAPAPGGNGHPPAEEGADSRDRRGRRSRRRRSRGRGFPESKYAADVAPHRPGGEEEPEAAETPAEEFPVLPGESLAKYRHAPHESEHDASSGADLDIEPAEADEIGADAEMAPPAATEPEEPQEGLTEPESAAVSEEPAESAPDEAEEGIIVPAADDAVSAEASEAVLAEESEEVAELAAVETIESPEETAGESDLEEEAATGYPPLASEFEESAEPEPGPAGEGETGTEAAGEAETGVEEPPAAEGVEPARTPVSLTATLREQGYRYAHRVSRRMRRKMRGAGYPEGRGEERRAEFARPAEEAAEERPEQRTVRAERPEKGPQPSITELLREGQEVLVQIAKEPLGQKGARITSHIALPGRYVVYMPTVEHLGVSRKIASDEERLRLKRILQSHRTGMTGGFIVRTAGEGRPESEIASDMHFLYNLWLDIRQKAESRPAPALIHHDLDLVQRILRDQMTESFKNIWIDNEEIYESVLRFVQRFQPSAVGRVKLYTRATPIFDAFNISTELEKALRPKVWLKSGGYIVINQTEALVAIDVNTGKFVGKSNRLEDTIVKTNTEAVKEIVRQIRLRDLGGIIVVDFIDMGERKNRQRVMQALEEAMRADRAPNKILQFNDFGLVAITRKRVKQSLERTLCSPCPYCEGSGYVKSVQTVIGEILQEAAKIAKLVESKDVSLRVHPEVAKVLKSSDNDYLEELEEILGRPVIITSDPTLQQEKFDLI